MTNDQFSHAGGAGARYSEIIAQVTTMMSTSSPVLHRMAVASGGTPNNGARSNNILIITNIQKIQDKQFSLLTAFPITRQIL